MQPWTVEDAEVGATPRGSPVAKVSTPPLRAMLQALRDARVLTEEEHTAKLALLRNGGVEKAAQKVEV